MKRLILLIAAAAVATAATAQDPHQLLKENPDRYASVHHSYEVPSTIEDTPAPKGYKPFYVSHYGRHGSRYMTTYANMDDVLQVFDIEADKGLLTKEGMQFYRDFKALREAHQDMLGYLTQKGADEHRGIAHRLWQRVPGVFSQKDRPEVMAASSTIQRCIQSMANFELQLQKDAPDLKVRMYTGDRYMNYILKSPSKSKNSALHKKVFDSLLYEKFNPGRLMDTWFNDPEEAAKHFGKFDAEHLFYRIFYEGEICQCLDEPLTPVHSYFTDEELFGLWFADNANLYDNETLSVENGSHLGKTAAAILKDIIEKADAAVSGNSRAADFRFGHDSGLFPLLGLIGVEGMEQPQHMAETSEPDGVYVFEMMPMASNLQLLFYRNRKGDVLVKLVRNEKETRIPALTPVSGPYYRWSDLREYFASLCNYRNCRLLYWNIQNGMWDGQYDNYDRFVAWVAAQNPDICVWCEGQSLYYTDTDKAVKKEEQYLVNGWSELAARYGHSYVYVGGHRDGYPQVITSRWPIENVERIVGAEPDSVVTHGAGWARIQAEGQTLNLVTLHTWPQKWAYRATDQEASKAENGGDRYRRMEIEYICNHTVLTHPDAADELWMMMGDHNARSRVDNSIYNYPEDDTRFLVHDFILGSTPYIDVVKDRHPKEFCTSMHGQSRIDFVYLTPVLNEKVADAHIVYDSYTEPVRNPDHISNFWHPSDHRPIIVDFKL